MLNKDTLPLHENLSVIINSIFLTNANEVAIHIAREQL